jgi:hypothetical protein
MNLSDISVNKEQFPEIINKEITMNLSKLSVDKELLYGMNVKENTFLCNNIKFPLNIFNNDYDFWLHFHTNIIYSLFLKDIILENVIFFNIFIRDCKILENIIEDEDKSDSDSDSENNFIPNLPIEYRNYLLSLDFEENVYIFSYLHTFVINLEKIGFFIDHQYYFLINPLYILSFNMFMNNINFINELLICFDNYKLEAYDKAIKEVDIEIDNNLDSMFNYYNIESDNVDNIDIGLWEYISLFELSDILESEYYKEIIKFIKLPELFDIIKCIKQKCIFIDLNLIKLYEFKHILDILEPIKSTYIPNPKYDIDDGNLSDVD